MKTKISSSLKRIDHRLFIALLLMGLCPTLYTTLRTFFLGQLPGEWSYSIAGQLSWINLIYEVVYSAYTWLGWRFYREFMYMTDSLRNLFGNILLMIPFGYILPLIWKERINKCYKAVLLGVGVSLLIEIIQLITLKGFCDIDDVILNGIGCVIGWKIYRSLF